MNAVPDARSTQAQDLLDLYDRVLPQVYGYLVRRVGDTATAEDITSATFLAAVTSIRSGVCTQVTTGWLIGIARHKLVDHWRRRERDERVLAAAQSDHTVIDDPWDAHLDASLARHVVASLGAHHRAVLTLRYADGLPVIQVAELLDRTVHATEALLVRARRAFRTAYLAVEPDRHSTAPTTPTTPTGGDDDR